MSGVNPSKSGVRSGLAAARRGGRGGCSPHATCPPGPVQRRPALRRPECPLRVRVLADSERSAELRGRGRRDDGTGPVPQGVEVGRTILLVRPCKPWRAGAERRSAAKPANGVERSETGPGSPPVGPGFGQVVQAASCTWTRAGSEDRAVVLVGSLPERALLAIGCLNERTRFHVERAANGVSGCGVSDWVGVSIRVGPRGHQRRRHRSHASASPRRSRSSAARTPAQPRARKTPRNSQRQKPNEQPPRPQRHRHQTKHQSQTSRRATANAARTSGTTTSKKPAATHAPR